jgi:hypothetical protein
MMMIDEKLVNCIYIDVMHSYLLDPAAAPSSEAVEE